MTKGKDKGNSVFRKVMHGTNNKTTSAKEREADERRAKASKETVKRLEADSRALHREIDRREREEQAYQRAEADRRKQKG